MASRSNMDILGDLLDGITSLPAWAFDQANATLSGAYQDTVDPRGEESNRLRPSGHTLDHYVNGVGDPTDPEQQRLYDEQQARLGYNVMDAPGRAIDRAAEFYFGKGARPVDAAAEMSSPALAPLLERSAEAAPSKAAEPSNPEKLIMDAKGRRDSRLQAQLAALKAASSPDSEVFSGQGNDILRGDGSKFEGPESGSFSKTHFKTQEDYAVRDMAKAGIPEPMARLIYQNRPQQSDTLSIGEMRNLRQRGFEPQDLEVLARSRSAGAERRADAAKTELSLLGNKTSPEQQEMALLQAAMGSKDPIAAMVYVRAMLKRLGRTDEEIDAILPKRKA